MPELAGSQAVRDLAVTPWTAAAVNQHGVVDEREQSASYLSATWTSSSVRANGRMTHGMCWLERPPNLGCRT